MTDNHKLGKTLWDIADQLRGAMNADDFRDYMLAFLFLRYLSDNYEVAAKKELGKDYPPGFRAALMLSTRSLSVEQYAARQFDVILHWEAARNRVRDYLDDGSPSKIALPAEIRQQAFARAEVFYSESLSQCEPQEAGTLPESLQPLEAEPASEDGRPWASVFSARPRLRTRSSLRVFQKVRIAAAELSRPSCVHPRVTRVGRLYFQLDHSLDNGIPYPKGRQANALIVDALPVHRYDPHKWMRSAAFSGYSLIRVAQSEEMKERLRHLERRIEQL